MIKKIFLWLHRWLGLVTGIVVIIVSITGCINVFADELKEYFYHNRYFAQPLLQPAERLNFSTLLNNAQQALGKKYKLSRCEVYPAANRNWVFRASKTDPQGFGHWNYYKYYFRVYVNPYTGKVVFIEDTKNEFFQLMLSLHLNLLLGDQVGKPITGVSVACFFVILVSGLIIWWPKRLTIKGFKAKLQIKRNAGPKRLNYDLHNAFGFYTLIPALIITITGLVFAFDWADNAVKFIADGGQTLKKRTIPTSSPGKAYKTIAIDSAINTLLHKHSTADVFAIRLRDKPTDPFNVQVRLAANRTHEFEWYYFDRNTGLQLLHYGNVDVKGGEKIRSLNYDLHTGAYAGLPTKILAFLASLVCASLPVTGFMIWYNKRQKKHKKTLIRRRRPAMVGA